MNKFVEICVRVASEWEDVFQSVKFSDECLSLLNVRSRKYMRADDIGIRDWKGLFGVNRGDQRRMSPIQHSLQRQL